MSAVVGGVRQRGQDGRFFNEEDQRREVTILAVEIRWGTNIQFWPFDLIFQMNHGEYFTLTSLVTNFIKNQTPEHINASQIRQICLDRR